MKKLRKETVLGFLLFIEICLFPILAVGIIWVDNGDPLGIVLFKMLATDVLAFLVTMVVGKMLISFDKMRKDGNKI